MIIWKWGTDVNNYDYLIIPDDLERKRLLFDYKFDGISIKDRWNPVKVEVLEEKTKVTKKSDTPSFGGGRPVLSERAVLILGYFLKGVTEVLPLKYSKEQYYVINVLDVIDCVDYEKAKYKMFPDSNRVMEFIEYAFKPDMVKNKHIFKIPEHPKSDVFVSDEFRKKVLDSGLEGFVFKEVWESEEDKSKSPKEQKVPKELQITYNNAKELQTKVETNAYNLITRSLKEIPKENCKLDSLCLEYYKDIASIEVLIRITTLLDNVKYQETYLPLLKHEDTAYDFKTLYNHYVKDDTNDSETNTFFKVIEEIVSMLNVRMTETNWEGICRVTNEFSIKEPELYD